jgi:diguanylate cyclase (GGDEF)-like protein
VSTSDDTRDELRCVVTLLRDLLSAQLAPPFDSRLTSIPGLRSLYEQLLELRELAVDLSKGSLSRETNQRGHIHDSLRALQESLREFVWQAQRVAEGDLSERADFMGSFAFAFNAMVERLEAAQSKLQERERKLKLQNEALRKEVAERRRLEAELQRMARHDALTGTLNRRGFLERAAQELTRSRRYKHPLSLLMLDVDRFKTINDRWGHPAGDAALVSLAAGCGHVLRVSDVIGRLGGEEFALLLTETPLDGAIIVAERLRVRLADCPFETAEGARGFTVSLGVAQWAAEETMESFIARADGALYCAKEGGRDRVSVASLSPDTRSSTG